MFGNPIPAKKQFQGRHCRSIRGNGGGDFLVEEFLTSHPSFAEANPASLNTLRVMTFTYRNQVCFQGAFFHFGVAAELASIAVDGLMAYVHEDGTIADVAYDENCRVYTESPNGYQFAGKKLAGVGKAIDCAKRLHSKIPQMRSITWEFTVNPEGEPVLIELNGGAEQRILQMSGGHTLVSREIAKELLDDWILKRSFYSRATYRWNYREYYDHVEIEKYFGQSDRIAVPATLKGKTVTAIYDYAFTAVPMKEILIPACVKNIGPRAFYLADPSCRIVQLSE